MCRSCSGHSASVTRIFTPQEQENQLECGTSDAARGHRSTFYPQRNASVGEEYRVSACTARIYTVLCFGYSATGVWKESVKNTTHGTE